MIERAKGLERKKRKERIGLHRYANEGQKPAARFYSSREEVYLEVLIMPRKTLLFCLLFRRPRCLVFAAGEGPSLTGAGI